MSQTPTQTSANAVKAPPPNPILYYYQKRIGGWAIFLALIGGIIASYIINANAPPRPNDYWWSFSRLLIGYSIFTYPFFSSLLSYFYYSVKKGKPSDHISKEELETLDQISPQEFDAYFKRAVLCKYITLGFNVGIWGIFILCGSGEIGMLFFPVIYFWTRAIINPHGTRKQPARVFKWKPDPNPRRIRLVRHRYNAAASDFTGGAIYDKVEW